MTVTEVLPEQINRIVSTVLHQIDVSNNSCAQIQISEDYSDLESYLSELLVEIQNKTQKRSYEFMRETTEFYTTLKSLFSYQDLNKNVSSHNIANRLLDKETDTDNRYGHLSTTGTGHVKKGSFLQFLYRDGSVISYLGVKIEHQSFIDEIDFKKKIGLSIANKIYKACKVSFNSDGLPHNVLIFDTNTKVSVYWWKDFLELKEIRDDSANTKKAAQEVIKVVNRLKNNHPADYTLLRNSSIAAFKQRGEMKYDEFITNIFENYTPIDKNLTEKLPDIVAALRQLPEKKQFDTRFNLVPGEVPFNRSKIMLTKEIMLSIDEGIENINEKIWAEKSPNGKKLVVIESPEAFDQFKLKERE